MNQQKHLDEIQKLWHFIAIRQLEDGTIVAMGELAFTRAIYFDCDIGGFARRFCYSNPDLAVEEYLKIESGDTLPKGWIATRPEQ